MMSDHPHQTREPASGRAHQPQERQPNLASDDPYAVLGLSRMADAREIKRAYFELVRQYPPETAGEAFKLVRAAYEKLQTGAAKAETDLFLFQPPPAWQPRKRQGKLDLSFDPQDVCLLLQAYGDLGRVDFKADTRPVKV